MSLYRRQSPYPYSYLSEVPAPHVLKLQKLLEEYDEENAFLNRQIIELLKKNKQLERMKTEQSRGIMHRFKNQVRASRRQPQSKKYISSSKKSIHTQKEKDAQTTTKKVEQREQKKKTTFMKKQKNQQSLIREENISGRDSHANISKSKQKYQNINSILKNSEKEIAIQEESRPNKKVTFQEQNEKKRNQNSFQEQIKEDVPKKSVTPKKSDQSFDLLVDSGKKLGAQVNSFENQQVFEEKKKLQTLKVIEEDKKPYYHSSVKQKRKSGIKVYSPPKNEKSKDKSKQQLRQQKVISEKKTSEKTNYHIRKSFSRENIRFNYLTPSKQPISQVQNHETNKLKYSEQKINAKTEIFDRKGSYNVKINYGDEESHYKVFLVQRNQHKPSKQRQQRRKSIGGKKKFLNVVCKDNEYEKNRKIK